MNNISNKEAVKDRFLKIVSVGGFIGLIIILAWLGIKIVAFMPTAVSSLASLADSVYNYRAPEITIVSNRSESLTGETFELSWPVPKQPGTFSISYACTDGVSADAHVNQNIVTLPCGEIYPLGAVSGVALRVFSERIRYADIPVTIHFIRANDDTIIAKNTRLIKVINENIKNEYLTDLSEPENGVEDNVPIEEPSTTVTQTPELPQQTVQYTYGVPVSDPDGVIDLEASYITVGTVTGSVFTPLGSLVANINQSAIQFAVKNIGTKTSDPWTYLLQLPNGTVYTSPTQEPLKPNERAVITQGFTTPSTGNHKIIGSVIITDINIANNSFVAPFVVK